MQTDSKLSARQKAALAICAIHPDKSTIELAKELGVSNSTFRNLLSGAHEKLGVHTRETAIAKALQLELIKVPSLSTPLMSGDSSTEAPPPQRKKTK